MRVLASAKNNSGPCGVNPGGWWVCTRVEDGLVPLTRAHSGRFHPDAEQMRACGDEERTVVAAPERHVGGADARPRFVRGLWQMQPPERHAIRRRDLHDAGCPSA